MTAAKGHSEMTADLLHHSPQQVTDNKEFPWTPAVQWTLINFRCPYCGSLWAAAWPVAAVQMLPGGNPLKPFPAPCSKAECLAKHLAERQQPPRRKQRKRTGRASPAASVVGKGGQ